MDVDTIKLMLFILYLTLLIVGGLVWFRVVHMANGDLYRKARLQGGYMPERVDDAAALAQP